jgi:hypothetical protein
VTGLRDYPPGIQAALAHLSGGRCYNPECERGSLIIVFRQGEPYIDYHIAHIRDAKPGNRYDPDMSDAERRSFANLILLCKPCHDLVDKRRPQDYPVERLQHWKREREGAVARDLAALGEVEEATLADLLVQAFRRALLDLNGSPRGAVAGAVRLDAPRPSRAAVPRPAKLDEAVRLLGTGAPVTVTSLKGAGGVGKTVLAQQVAHDPRVRLAYPGGIWWLTVGEDPELEKLAEILYRKASGGRQPAAGVSVVSQLPNAMDKAPALVILDDVWPPADVAEDLLGALPETVHALITTRGAELPGSVSLSVDELTVDETRAVLLGLHAATASPDLITHVDHLGGLLGRWALLVAMAGAVLRPNLGGPTEHAVVAIETISADFQADPTVLDDEDSRQRSFSRIIERSEASLCDRGAPGAQDVERFRLLGVYPADAELEVELLADLWDCRITEARRTVQRMADVGLATLERPTKVRPLALSLHDLIVGYLHHEHCRPGQFPERHRQCASVAIADDGQPLQLTPPRARWLVHHLVAAGEWSLLENLASLRWRSALLDCTGTDAMLFDALDAYARAAMRDLRPADGAHHVFTAVVFAAHIRALIGNVPIEVLRTMVLLGNPQAALVQSAERPDAVTALSDVLAVALRAGWSEDLGNLAIELAATVLDDVARSRALADIAQRIAASEPNDAERVQRAVELATTIPDGGACSRALAGIAQKVIGSNAAWATELIERAVEATATIEDDGGRSNALADIAERWSAVRPFSAGCLERAVQIVMAIPFEGPRSRALADIAPRLAASDPERATELGERAVELAATITDNGARSRALAGIAREVVASDPVRARNLVERSVELALTITDDGARSRALGGVAQQMVSSDSDATAGLFDQAIELAATVSDDRVRNGALAGIAQMLAASDPSNARNIELALDLAASIGDEWQRSRALAGITQRLATYNPPNPGSVQRAIELTANIPNAAIRSRSLAGIAQQFRSEPARAMDLIERAVLVAGTIQSDGARSRVLATIAQQVAAYDPARATELLERAVELASAIPGDRMSARALADIARQAVVFEPAKVSELMEGAVELATIIPNTAARDRALSGIALGAAASDPPDAERFEWAVTVTGRISHDESRSRTLAGLARQVAASNPAKATMLIKLAVDVADAITNTAARSRALADIAQMLVASEPTNAGRVEQAVELASAIPDVVVRSRALIGIAGQVTPSRPDIATELIERAAITPEDGIRSRALVAVAQQVAESEPVRSKELIDQAVELAATIADTGARARALAGIAQQLAAFLPARATELVERAVEVAHAIPNTALRSRALADVAQRRAALDPSDAGRVSLAVELAVSIPDYGDRIRALTGIAQQVAASNPASAAGLIEHAIDLAADLPQGARGRTLAGIALRLAASDPPDAGRIERAVELAASIASAGTRSRTSGLVAQRLMAVGLSDPRAVELAVAAAATIPDERHRRQTQAFIAGSIGDTRWCIVNWRQVRLGEFLEAIATFVSASAHHPEVGRAAIGSVVRTVTAFARQDRFVGGQFEATFHPE